MADMTMRGLQEYIRSKDHHPELKLQYFQKLVEEVGELAKAIRKETRYCDTQNVKGTLEEELYDVLYYVVALSNTYDVDLETIMRLKEPLSSAKYGHELSLPLDDGHRSSKTAFLITGKPRTGKSTTVKKLVNVLGSDICGGFYTEEITDSDTRIGFRCVSVSGESVEIANVESPSPIRVGRYGVDVDKFERFAIKVLKDALSCSKKVIIIDEIGFMQMLSIPFRDTLRHIINSECVVLGTVPVASHPKIDQIKAHKAVKIIDLNESNRDVTSQLVAQDILSAVSSVNL